MPVKYKRYLTYIIILLILFAVRIYLLDQAPMADYDSVKNYLIAKEITEGNLTQLFHRRIPVVHLINAAILLISPNFLSLEYFHAFISTLGIFLFCLFINRRLEISLLKFFFLNIIIGLSTVTVLTSRYMSIESWSLLLFAGFISQYVHWIEKRESGSLIKASMIYSLCFLVNYKFLFMLPVFLGLELWISRNYYSGKSILEILVILAAPFLLMSFLGLFTGHGFSRFIAAYGATVLGLGSEGSFNFDLLFYPRYILEFENPLLFVILIWACWHFRDDLKKFRKDPSMIGFLLFFVIIYWILISFNRKAPRALLFIIPMLYFFLYRFATDFVQNRIVSWLLIILTVGYSLLQIQKHIYTYSHTSYDKVAKAIENEGIDKILITSGLGIVPYLEEVSWKVIFDDSNLEQHIAGGYHYALVDDYRIITAMDDFSLLEKGEIITETEEISLKSPLLALEHAEFTRTGYSSTLQRSQEVKTDSINLKLIRIKP